MMQHDDDRGLCSEIWSQGYDFQHDDVSGLCSEIWSQGYDFHHDVVRGLCVLVLVLEILCFVLLMMVGALCSMVVSVCFLNFVVASEDDMEIFSHMLV